MRKGNGHCESCSFITGQSTSLQRSPEPVRFYQGLDRSDAISTAHKPFSDGGKYTLRRWWWEEKEKNVSSTIFPEGSESPSKPKSVRLTLEELTRTLGKSAQETSRAATGQPRTSAPRRCSQNQDPLRRHAPRTLECLHSNSESTQCGIQQASGPGHLTLRPKWGPRNSSTNSTLTATGRIRLRTNSPATPASLDSIP